MARPPGGDTVQQAGELRLARVESLRALAALGVVAGHLVGHYYASGGAPDNPITRVLYGGGFGVLLFFCLTGYLLFWPFVRQHFLGAEPLPLRRYALNRFLRIFPLYWISVVAILLVRDNDVEGAWWKYMLFAENFFRDSIANPQVNGVLWSVVVELHYYLLLPVLAVAIAVVSRRSLAGASVILLVLGGTSLYLWVHFWQNQGDEMWRLNLPASFFFFTGGMQLALLRAHIDRGRPRWLDGPLGSGGLWFAVGSLTWVVAWYRYDLVGILAIGSALMLAPCVLPLRDSRLVSWLSWRPLAYVGVISYSIYIWHTPLMYELFERTGAGSEMAVVVSLVLTAAISVFSFHLIETPFLRLRKRWTRGANVGDERTDDPPPAQVPAAALDAEPRDLGGGVTARGGLRVHTARGVLINSAFNIGFSLLGTMRRVLVAIFLTAAEFGLWGLIFVALNTVLLFKQIGIGDKYIQQSEEDQERAFRKAFTLDAALTMILFVIALAALPLFAVLYDEWGIVAPGAALALALPLSLLSFPLIVFYRRLEYAKQRLVGGVEPVVGIIVTISLAASGVGVWSLVIGQLSAMLAGGLVTLYYSPYRLGFAYDRGTLRSYASFSWPLMVNQGSTLATVQSTAIAGKSAVGLTGLGAIGLSGSLSQLADGIDAIITRTMYPAICRVADRIDLLHEAFVKSNRLALMWGVPFGGFMTLFAQDLIDHVFGARWQHAVPVIAATGIAVAITQVGFNWTAFMRARNDTRGIGVVAVGGLVASLVLTVPLLLLYGLEGFVWGMIARALVQLALRGHYLRRMFHGFGLTRHLVRSFLPVVPAAGAVLLMRYADDTAPSAVRSLGELVIYGSVAAVATFLFERALLLEAWGYVRRAANRPPAQAAS